MRVAVPNTCQSLAGLAHGVYFVVPGPGGFFDAALGFGLLPGDALGVDPEQHVDAVARPSATCVAGTPAFSQVETAAWRRS